VIFELKVFGLPLLYFSWARAELVEDDAEAVSLGSDTEVAEGDSGDRLGYGFARGGMG